MICLLHIFEAMDIFTKHKIFEYDTKDKVLMDKLFSIFRCFFFLSRIVIFHNSSLSSSRFFNVENTITIIIESKIEEVLLNKN